MKFQWWNMFSNCSIFLCSVQNWDKKLQVIFLRSLSYIFNDKWSTWDKFGSYQTQSFQQIKVLIEFVIISDILLLTSSCNYFCNIFPSSKGYGLESQQIFQNYSLMSYFVSGPQRINVIFLCKLSWRMPFLFLSRQDCMCISPDLSCKGQEGKSKLALDPYCKV